MNEAASTFQIKLRSVQSIITKYMDEGTTANRKRGGARSIVLTQQVLDRIESIVEQNNAVTLKQIQEHLAAEDLDVSLSSIANGLKRLMLTLKKARIELDRVNSLISIAARQAYALDFTRNSPTDKRKCIFVDESGFNLHLTAIRARSRKGTRASVVVPTIRGRSVTLISAMSSDGILFSKIIDDGTVTAIKFNGFMMELVTELQAQSGYESAWILMDNARIHRRVDIEEI